MAIHKLPLEKLISEYASLEPVAAVGCNVYHVRKPSVLVQAAGYLKHLRAKSPHNKSVYFRGQSKLYPTLPPSLYRGLTKPDARDQRDAKMQVFLKRVRKEQKVLRAVDEHIREPLLQHYGFKTRWLDVVDNVWVALWFACHTARIVGEYGEYLHFEKRIVRQLSR
jgi:hypothetical protein